MVQTHVFSVINYSLVLEESRLQSSRKMKEVENRSYGLSQSRCRRERSDTACPSPHNVESQSLFHCKGAIIMVIGTQLRILHNINYLQPVSVSTSAAEEKITFHTLASWTCTAYPNKNIIPAEVSEPNTVPVFLNHPSCLVLSQAAPSNW